MSIKTIQFCGAEARLNASCAGIEMYGNIVQWWQTDDFIVVKLDGEKYVVGKDISELNANIVKVMD